MRAPEKKKPAAIQGFVFDLDGTLVMSDRHHKGYRALPGARKVLAELRRRGLPFVAMTNGSIRTPAEYAVSLRAAGLDLEPARIMTPATVAAGYLSAKGYKRVLVLGCPGVWKPLAAAGLDVILPDAGKENVDTVFIGWHPEFGMRDLEAACKAVWAGAPVFSASDARFFATRDGPALGISGAIGAMITSVTGKRPVVLGKPSQHVLRQAAQLLGVPARHLCVVGDDPALEVAMARKGGAYAIAVLTGLAKPDTLAALPPQLRPHLVLGTIGELLSSGTLPAASIT